MTVRSRVRGLFALAAFLVACGGTRSTPGGPTIDPPPITPQTAVLVGAGDIADCANEGGTPARNTGKLLDTLLFDAIFTAGDNAYPLGSPDDFKNCYDAAWGRFKSKTYPVPGNHDYSQPGALPYFQYFGDRSGPEGFRAGYYSYNLGNWHILALNSLISAAEQIPWVRQELDENKARCTLAYWHYPVFTSGPSNGTADQRVMRDMWRLLFEQGVDVVVNGHDHLYERFLPQDGDGRPNPTLGMTEFVVGTGGAPMYLFGATALNSAAQLRAYGILKLTLRLGDYDSVFVPVAGAPFDLYHGSCH
jgi:3',5'-cyclic AMP phosphodiesterase CpdA